MAKPHRVGDLEITEDLAQQRREWRIERVSWVVMALVLLAALAGLLGPGPLSAAVAGEPGSALWVDYERLLRHQAPARLRVHLGPGAARGGAARVTLNRSFVEHIRLQHLDPAPASVTVGPDAYTYTFTVADAGRASAVTFYFEPNTFGSLPVVVGLDGGPQRRFRPFSYP